MFAAVLDTCVIYGGLRRDLLLTMSAHGVFRAVLSDDLLDEIEYVEERKLQELGTPDDEAEARARRLVEQMRNAFEVLDQSRVDLIGEVGLPDPDDEHIVAAAVAGGADVIVTDNLRHFPEEKLPDGLRVQGPQTFLHDMVTAHPHGSVLALQEMARRRGDPPQTEADIIDLLLVKGLAQSETADILRRGLERWA